VSTWLFDDPPQFRKGTITNLIFSIGIVLFASLNVWYLIIQNKRKASAMAPGVADKASHGSRTKAPLDDRDAQFGYTL
jgi:hypothetical protein